MNLIIVAKLTCNEGLYFRFLTMMAKSELDYDILIEAENNKEIDKYYKLLVEHRWHDFIDDFIVPEWAVEGVRIDTELIYPLTIKTSQITCQNIPNILGQIKSLKSI